MSTYLYAVALKAMPLGPTSPTTRLGFSGITKPAGTWGAAGGWLLSEVGAAGVDPEWPRLFVGSCEGSSGLGLRHALGG